jgi:putative PIN family toxin of toxin-antitoxin system
MQKLVIDTNVFISSLIQRSYPYLITTELFSNKEIHLCISDEVFEEYYDVLNREKFERFADFITKAQTLLTNISRKATKYSPTFKVHLIKDTKDNKFLELSETCKADFLITGNTNDFTMKEYKRTIIVTPKQYWENYLIR